MIHTPAKEHHHKKRQGFSVQALIQQLEQEPADRQRLLKVLAQEPPRDRPLHVTYEEFLAWADEDTVAEWVNGEVFMSSPASLPHQAIVKFLTNVLSMFAETRSLGMVINAPFQMKMEHGREPDVLFVARKHVQRLKNTYLDGPADLVVEVISPESAGRDRGDKFYEYERGGVSEYWLLDPLTQRAEFYQLRAGRYQLIQPDREMKYYSQALPGFWLKVEWLWRNPLPHPLEVLGEIANVPSQEIERLLGLLQGQPSLARNNE